MKGLLGLGRDSGGHGDGGESLRFDYGLVVGNLGVRLIQMITQHIKTA